MMVMMRIIWTYTEEEPMHYGRRLKLLEFNKDLVRVFDVRSSMLSLDTSIVNIGQNILLGLQRSHKIPHSVEG
jgi:hypothetical protein